MSSREYWDIRNLLTDIPLLMVLSTITQGMTTPQHGSQGSERAFKPVTVFQRRRHLGPVYMAERGSERLS